MDIRSLFSLCLRVITRWEVIVATLALVLAWTVLRYIAVVAGVERKKPSRRIRHILNSKAQASAPSAPPPKESEREEGFRREE